MFLAASIAAGLVAAANVPILKGRPAETMAGCLAAIFAAVILFTCCRTVASEMRNRTLELLVLSELSPEQIVVGPVLRQVKRCAPWLVGLVLALAWSAVSRGDMQSAGNFLTVYTVALCTYAVIALWLTLRTNAYIAMGVVTVLLALFWPVVAEPAVSSLWTSLVWVSVHLVVLYVALPRMLRQAGRLEACARQRSSR